MIVDPKGRRVVLRVRDPDALLAALPTAQPYEYRGARLVVVPLALNEMRVLTNMGIAVPSPIRHYYDWPGKKPYEHQVTTAEFLTLRPRSYCLNDLGTGKTLSILWAYDYLARHWPQGGVGSMLVVAPLSTLERVWADEIFANFPHLAWQVLHGSQETRRARLEKPADVYLINHDGLMAGSFHEALCQKPGLDVVVIDELATFRNRDTRRWDALNLVCKHKHWVWGLTGTPIPNTPLDAWGQCMLINPTGIPRRKQFRDMTMRQVSQFQWEPKANALDVVYATMQPAVRYSRDECIDLPPTSYETVSAAMTPEQHRVYQDMLRRLSAECAAGQIVAANEAVKAMRLVQIGCGVAYAEDGSSVMLGAKPRVAVVQELIESARGKVIVFVPFVGALAYVAELLGKEYAVAVVHGGVAKGARDKIFQAFQQEASPRVLVAQPAAMSHGLTLTAADTIVWYAPVTSSETYVQANARITRPGQTAKTLVCHVESSPIERDMYRRLQRKERMQGILLNFFEKKELR